MAITLDSECILALPVKLKTQQSTVATFIVAQYTQHRMEKLYGADVTSSSDADHVRRLMTASLQFVLKNSVLITEFITVFDDLTMIDGTLSLDAIGDLDCLGDLVRFADAFSLTYRRNKFQ